MNIVVGYVKTPEGQAALDRAVEEARLRSATLHVVHSIGYPPTTESPSQVESWKAKTDKASQEGDALESDLRKEGIDVVVDVVAGESDNAAQVLLDHVEQLEAGLLVVGLRSRSRVGKLLLGSVAQDVLLRAPCPVLAVKP